MSALASATLPSERRLAANRANAQLSTGPRTEAGKTISSVNAVKSGLTGRTVLLPSDDVEAYKAHIARFEKTLAPVGDQEKYLVQSLADTQWRLDRIPNLEAGMFALGRLRHAELFAEQENLPLRRAMIDAHILVEDAKHLKNLHLQESRLLRRYQQDLKELKELQAERKKAEEEKAAAAKPKTLTASVGFEFTTPEPTRSSLSVTPDSNAPHAGRSLNIRTAAADLSS
jgi:hypothetical protein